MSERPVALRLSGVRRDYRAGSDAVVHAVEDVSLDVARGRLTLLMGPSGSGKTTLLSLAGGLLAPSAGTVEVDGVPLASLAPAQLTAFRLRRIGFVFQRFRLLEALTGLENVELPLCLAGMARPASRERAERLWKDVGLGGQGGTRAGRLSGGEQQRVAIARALANDPPLLLADEPTGSLDSHAGQRIIALLHAAAKAGKAVLVVSHDERLAPHADAIVRMEDGRVRSVEGR